MPTDPTNDYRFGYSQDELKRLGDQHRVWAADNRRFLSRAAFGEGATVVDLGCGPGYTTLDLARAVGPEGRVIAVDRDGERSLSLLRERAEEAGFSNVETRVAELEVFDLPQASVDGVYGRWVLMYLPERAVAPLIERVAGWLKPSAVCALAELCNYRHIHIHPPSAHLPAIAEALMRAVAGDRGCNPEIGNLLPGLLHRSGLRVELHVSTKAVRATTPEWLWPDVLFRDHLPALVDEGLLSREMLDAFLAEWNERSRDPGAVFFGSPMMEVVGRRP
ncbi:MAG: methyltransferase domain-containing protein [Acidobacteria bacterium]|jgi:SAM-dependent methyltransferase|nr:methyltransferase domain-containing protein [Acidobacteriota bacterium]